MTRTHSLRSGYNEHLLNVLTSDSSAPGLHPSQSSSTLVIPGQETAYLAPDFSSLTSLLLTTIQLFLHHGLPIVSPPQRTQAHLQSLGWPSALWGECAPKCTLKHGLQMLRNDAHCSSFECTLVDFYATNFQSGQTCPSDTPKESVHSSDSVWRTWSPDRHQRKGILPFIEASMEWSQCLWAHLGATHTTLGAIFCAGLKWLAQACSNGQESGFSWEYLLYKVCKFDS